MWGELRKWRESKSLRQREANIHKQPPVMRTQDTGAFVHEGDDAVSTTCIRRAGMRVGAVETQYIARLRQPDLTISGKQLAAVEIAKEAYQR